MGTMPQVYPHLILDNFTTKLGERIANILKHLSCAKAIYKTHNHFFQSVGLYFIQVYCLICAFTFPAVSLDISVYRPIFQSLLMGSMEVLNPSSWRRLALSLK
ncbi:unnamed protein product [Prunus brigantina]